MWHGNLSPILSYTKGEVLRHGSDAKLRIAVQQHISILQSGTAEQKVKALKELNAHSAAWPKVAAWIIEEGGVDPLIEIMCGGMETPRESVRSTLVRITLLATRSEGSKVWQRVLWMHPMPRNLLI